MQSPVGTAVLALKPHDLLSYTVHTLNSELTMAQKIKVCHLTSVHHAQDTRILKKECATLASRYDVHLIAPHSKNEINDGVKIHALPAFRSRLARFLITDPFLFVKALGTRARIYHIHDPELIPYAMILRLSGKRIIYDVHEIYLQDIKEKKWLPLKGLFRRIYQYFEKLACRHFFLVLAESSYADFYREKKAKFEIVRNFVRPEIFEEIANMPRKEERRTLLMVGNPAARRGLPVIFEAMKQLKNNGVRIHFLCVGNKNKDLEKILAESGAYREVKDQVEFTGFVPIPDAYGRAPECFAGIALPEDLPNHRESYPTKIFEYMAVSLPVICSNFPINREVIETHDCGICVNPRDSSEIADAIRYIQSQPALAEQIGGRGKQALQNKYNWVDEGEKLLEVYEKLLS